jgi:hypothetical protein
MPSGNLEVKNGARTAGFSAPQMASGRRNGDEGGWSRFKTEYDRWLPA